ncbi:TPA: hypothetical protein ACLAO2_000690, partial [Neisseria meningitidis]
QKLRDEKQPEPDKLDSCLRGNDGVLSCCSGLLFFVEMTRLWIARIYPFRRHSHKSGNPEMKSNRNLSEMTETERTGFPPARE